MKQQSILNLFILLIVHTGSCLSQPRNLIIGYQAGVSNTYTGSLFLGYQSGKSNINGGENTFVGYQTGTANTNGSGNTFVGYLAGVNNTAQLNTFIGQRAGANNTTGTNNVFVGAGAGANNTTGKSNFILGASAGLSITTGDNNVFIGEGAAFKGNTSNNIAIGLYAGNNFRAPSTSNVAVGIVAGTFAQQVSNSVFLGKDSGVPESFATTSLDNVVTLGANVQVTKSNSVILGNNANVGIGTSAPNNKLEIVSSAAGVSGLRLTNMTAASPGAIVATSRFLTVNAQGDVVMGSTSGARIAATEATWSLKEGNLINENTGGVIIGNMVKKIPSGYGLYVGQGILTEKVKVAIANSSDWADHVLMPTYQLMPLYEVDRYIRQYHHLPDIPSAQEVVAKGVDLSRMDAQLLAKIEELTLHVIQLQKQVDQLKTGKHSHFKTK